MHDGSVATGDSWLKNNLSGYAAWAKTHNSLLIVTFDEDDSSAGNQILNVFYGDHVRTGTYPEAVSHYSNLSTIESAFGLPHLNSAAAVTDVWQ
jgi:acid phosphatase